MSCEKGKLLFLHTSDLMKWILCPKIYEFSFFYHPSSIERDISFKESVFDSTY